VTTLPEDISAAILEIGGEIALMNSKYYNIVE
jgi:hypothetical protein